MELLEIKNICINKPECLLLIYTISEKGQGDVDHNCIVLVYTNYPRLKP